MKASKYIYILMYFISISNNIYIFIIIIIYPQIIILSAFSVVHLNLLIVKMNIKKPLHYVFLLHLKYIFNFCMNVDGLITKNVKLNFEIFLIC